MYNTLIRNIIRFIGLVLLQIAVFDNLRFGNYIHPCIYVIFILLMPFDTPTWKLMINGFLIGFVVDIFNGTPGLNASATVFMSYLRPFIIDITTRKSDIEGKNEPSIFDMGLQWFMIYSFLLLVIHNLFLFGMEAFSIKLFGVVLLEVLLSVPISLIIIILLIYLLKPVKTKSNY